MSEESILYVEDEEDYRLLVSNHLTKAGFRVQMAETGEEAFVMLAKERPDLLILDVNLPDTTGYKICRRVREDPAWADLPILMLTVRRRPEEWLEGFASGADDYMSKPLNPPELIERVQTCLLHQASSPTRAEKPEYQLTKAVLAGNRGAYDVLLRRHKQPLIEIMNTHVSNPAEAEDIVSSAFIVAYERLGQFKGDSAFSTWLYRIAFNELSHRRRNPTVSFGDLDPHIENELIAPSEPNDLAVWHSSNTADLERLRVAISRVPEKFREILEMNVVEDLSYDAIATRLQIPTGTVMSRLYKARELLREAWERAEKGGYPRVQPSGTFMKVI